MSLTLSKLLLKESYIPYEQLSRTAERCGADIDVFINGINDWFDNDYQDELIKLYSEDKYKPLFDLCKRYIQKDSMVGSTTRFYRGLFFRRPLDYGADDANKIYMYYILENKRLNDIINLTTVHKPLQGFTTSVIEAANFAYQTRSYGAIGIVIEAKIKTENVVLSGDTAIKRGDSSVRWFAPHPEEEEYIIEMQRQPCHILFAKCYVNNKWYDVRNNQYTFKEIIGTQL